MNNLIEKIFGWFCEGSVKEVAKIFIQLLLPSTAISFTTKILSNIPWKVFWIILIVSICILSICTLIIKRQREKQILEDYKALTSTDNYDFFFSENWLLEKMAKKSFKHFLINTDFNTFLNEDIKEIEENDPFGEDERALFYKLLTDMRNPNYIRNIINNLIARGFITKKNDFLLKINDKIYNFIVKENKDIEKRRQKNKEKERKEELEYQKLLERKNRPSICRKIQISFSDFMRRPLILSNLPHTWILDVDGTIVKHKKTKDRKKEDILLKGVKDFFDNIPFDDKVILLTAREEKYLPALKDFLKTNNIRYDSLLTDMPMGERILVNDRKPSGLDMAFAINKNRDEELKINYGINKDL